MPEDKTKYRPICLISVFGKLYENLINMRLQSEIDEKGGLSNLQFGFRKKRSTVNAVQEMIRIARGGAGKGKPPKWCALILIDVQNAFNTASWNLILQKLLTRGISRYLINIIAEYFTERYILIDKGLKKPIGGGVPQGSVLGPTLWNVLYDDVTKIKLPLGSKPICYADDLAIVITASSKEKLTTKVENSLEEVCRYMKQNKLKIANKKTKAILLRSAGNIDDVTFKIENDRIRPVHTVEYLGFTINKSLRFKNHIDKACEKARKTAKALSALMPNVRGPTENKKKVMCMAIQSVLLYGAPIWNEAAQKHVYRKKLLSAQRLTVLRICSAYRTVSTDALLVLAGIVPIHLMADERNRLFKYNNIDQNTKRMEREETIKKWQQEWDGSSKGVWTRRLIKDVKCWMSRKWGQVNYFVTQCLTGHGCYKRYLYKFRRCSTPICDYCPEIDDANHTIFACPRWERDRVRMNIEIGLEVNAENMTMMMLKSAECWDKIEFYLTKIMKSKIDEEKNQERRRK